MAKLNHHIHSVTAFAPATCANVAVGFDILGFALSGLGDKITLTLRNDQKIVIDAIHSQDTLPYDKNKNTASVALQALCRSLKLRIGFSMQIQKGIPLSSGLGGSAASAVAAVVAANQFLQSPLPQEKLIQFALLGEAAASGEQHADNVVPSLLGGLTLIRSLEPLDVIALPVPQVHCALVHPHLQVATKNARKVLKKTVLLQDYVRQSANLAATIAALYKKDLSLLQQSMSDILIEPQRAQFVPGFYKIKAAALQAGALGVSFSGSGPTLFALTKTKQQAKRVMSAMQAELMKKKIVADGWVSSINKKAAHIIKIQRV